LIQERIWEYRFLYLDLNDLQVKIASLKHISSASSTTTPALSNHMGQHDPVPRHALEPAPAGRRR